MQIHTFIVDSAAEAVGQVRAKLGPDAVVLSVRRLPVDGFSKLWKKNRIEVLAAAPPPASAVEPESAKTESNLNLSVSGLISSSADLSAPSSIANPPTLPDPLLELRRELSEIRVEISRGRHLEPIVPLVRISPSAESEPVLESETLIVEAFVPRGVSYPGKWTVGPILEATGLMPIHALKIIERLCQEHGETPPGPLAAQLVLAGRALRGEWILPSTVPAGPLAVHVFIGPPGSGKTTALCKWLAQAVLIEGQKAEVWRLDGATANTAESLSIYGEILGVQVERFVPVERPTEGLLFIDLPGVAAADTAGLLELDSRLSRLGPAQIHLVLNVAYESAVLMAQTRAFGGLKVTDIIATHLDEESRWGKIWNWVLGTNIPVGWMSSGQNIPGQFRKAEPGILVERQFSR